MRPASCRPASPSAANLPRHLRTVLSWTPTSFAATALEDVKSVSG
jgi:hypothetical protein